MRSSSPSGLYTFIGEQPFEPTGWDPAVTQQVLTAAIARFPQIDVIVSDSGPSLVGALPEFEKSGRSIPKLLATSDANLLGCFFQEKKPTIPISSCTRSRPATTTFIAHNPGSTVALATGGVVPPSTRHQQDPFENSLTGIPNEVGCRGPPARRHLPVGGALRGGAGGVDGWVIPPMMVWAGRHEPAGPHTFGVAGVSG